MRKTLVLAAWVLVLAALCAVPAHAARRNGATLSFTQYGVEAISVQSRTDFEIRGTGFRTFSPAWVCIVGHPCVRTDVDPFGGFVQTRNLSYPGTYTVQVFQWKNQNGGSSELVSTRSVMLQ